MTTQMRKRTPRRLLAWALAASMALPLLPLSARAEESAGQPTSGFQNIYANGAALILAAGEDPAKTVVYIDNNADGEINGTDAIYTPGGKATDGTEAGNDLSKWRVFGGSDSAAVDGDTKITMLGGKVKNLYGGGEDGIVNGKATVSVSGGTVTWLHGGGNMESAAVGGTVVSISGGEINYVSGGGGLSSTVNSDISVKITGGTVNYTVDGCGESDKVTGNVSIAVSGGTIRGSLIGGGALSDTTVDGAVSLTLGGTAKVGNASESAGVFINGGDISNGVARFAIDPPLTDDAAIVVCLPEGYDASELPTIAAGAAEGDLARLSLTGPGAAGMTLIQEGTDIKVRPPVIARLDWTNSEPESAELTAADLKNNWLANLDGLAGKTATLSLLSDAVCGGILAKNTGDTVLNLLFTGDGGPHTLRRTSGDQGSAPLLGLVATNGDITATVENLTLDGTYDTPPFAVHDSPTLISTDHDGERSVSLVLGNGAIVQNGGKVDPPSAISNENPHSGGVFAQTHDSVTMKPGSAVKNNVGTYAGGVSTDGFIMKGGEISGNLALEGFGGLSCGSWNAPVVLSGGTISGNSSLSSDFGAGGVFLDGMTELSGTKITGNTGVFVGGIITNPIEITLTDCEITGNRAALPEIPDWVMTVYPDAKSTYDAYLADGVRQYAMAGGMAVTMAEISLSGDVVIKDNYIGEGTDTPSNLVLLGMGTSENAVYAASEEAMFPIISVTGALTGGAKSIGVSRKSTSAMRSAAPGLTTVPGVVAEGTETYKLTETDLAAFFSDDPSYELALDKEQNQIVLQLRGLSEGDGSEETPFLIESYDDLALLAAQVNGGNDFQGKFIQVASSFATKSGAVTVPIGTKTAPFAGSFDGSGKTIRLAIDAPQSDYQGLFGYVAGSGAAVQNVAVSGSVSGSTYVGGIAGYAANCDLTNCGNTAQITGGFNYVGGIAGENKGTMANCYSTGSISGSLSAGGIAGKNDGIVKFCYSTGAVAGEDEEGGIAGRNAGTMEHCLALGLDVANIGGNVGRIVGANGSGTLVNNYARSDMTLSMSGWPSTPTSTDPTSLNGADLKADGSRALSDVFSDWTGWDVPAGTLQVGCALPVPAGVTAPQTPILPGAATLTKPDGTTVGYSSASQAIADAMSGGGALKLLNDLADNIDCNAPTSFTIDLNGKTWTAKDDAPALTISHADAAVTIIDTAGGGKLDGRNGSAVEVTAGLLTVSGNGALTLAGGTSDGISGVKVSGSGSVRLVNPNASYTGDNGLYFNATGTYEITGGTFEAKSTGIYLFGGIPQGELTVTRASGEHNGLSIMGTPVVIAGGIFTGSAGLFVGGSDPVTLRGGTFTGTNGGYAVDTTASTNSTVSDLPAPGYGYFQNGAQITEPGEQYDQQLAPNGTVTVQRVPSGADSHAVSGIVTESGALVAGASVKLMQGGKLLDSTTTDTQGKYRFADAKSGSYNVVAEKDGKTMTILVTVSGEDAAEQDIAMPSGNINSVLKVEGGETPAVVVGGLENEAQKQEQNAPGSTVTVTMTVEAKEESAAAGANDIKETAAGKTLDFLEIKVEKQVDTNEPEPIATTNNLLVIVVPFDMTGKRDVAVYRYHGSAVDVLTGELNAHGEYIETGADSVALHVKNFSTYAIGYAVDGGTHSSGSSGGTAYTITASAQAGGSISPSGKVRVSRGASKTFAIQPDEGYEIADVLVDGESVGAVASYTFEKVAAAHIIEARFRKTEGVPFTDVRPGDWYYDSVRYVSEHALMLGTASDTFSPHAATTRGMIVTILWRLEQSPESGADMRFADVAPGSYYYEAVRWAAAHEIVKGYDAQSFGPDDAITREQLAAILYRYSGYKGYDVNAADDLTRFADAPSDWARDAVSWAVGAGVLSGQPGSLLDPLGRATRAEAATMLERFHRMTTETK